MTSLDEHETNRTVSKMENDKLFKFLPEAVLECRCPIKRPVSQTLTNIEKAVLVFMFFIVKIVIVSGPTTANTKDVQEPFSFRLVSVGIVGVGFSDSTSREWVLP